MGEDAKKKKRLLTVVYKGYKETLTPIPPPLKNVVDSNYWSISYE